MTSSDKFRINELLLRSLEEEITPEEFAELDRLLAAGPENLTYYKEIIDTYLGLYEYNEMLAASREAVDPVLEDELWKSLAEYEKSAPAEPVETVKAPKPVKVDKTPYPSERQINRFSLYSAIAATAALVSVLVYINVAPVEPAAEPVATLVDSINAQWGSSAEDLKNSSRLSAVSGSLRLTHGIVKLLFDSEAEVVIEAPADFRILTADQIYLNYGRLYAMVPPDAIGFTVISEKSRVIDLGTEFGVEVKDDQTTQLHVIKGKTTLVSGEKRNKKSMPVTEGQAREVSGSTAGVSNIACRENLFVRNIDSAENLIWRGQKQINLADVVGGGCGFGTGRINMGINPVSGRLEKPTYDTRKAPNDYVPVPSNTLIDGVFVPNGPAQIVTSAGHRFQNCPATSGEFFADVISTPRFIRASKDHEDLPILLGGVNYCLEHNPCIFLHSNLGITFDLEAFRARLPGAQLREFTADIGISDSILRQAEATFWVLTDGQVRCRREVRTRGRAETIRIEIRDSDRFLTLMATDIGEIDSNNNPYYDIGYDWCVFGRPVLVLK